MASKLSYFVLPRRFPIALLQALRLSSLPNPTSNQNYDSATAATKNNLYPDKLDLLRRVYRQKNSLRSSSDYVHLISNLGVAKNREEMEALLKEMVKFQYPDVESALELLVGSFVRHKKLKEALLVFETAASAKLRLSASTCNVLLSGVLEERLDFGLSDVLFVYKEMVKGGILPNVDTLNCLIEALVEAGLSDLALDQFGKMERKNCVPNSRTFEVLISGLCCNKRVDEAIKVWNQMVEIGCRPDSRFCARLIPLLCRVGRLEAALKLFGIMKSLDFLPDLSLFKVLIGSLCGSQRVDDAIEVFEEIGESGLVPVTSMHVDIVNGYCELTKFGEATSFLQENGIFESEPHNALLIGFCNRGKLLEALSYLKKMEERGISDPISWNILIRGYCEKGYIGKAFEILAKMIVSAWSPDGETYSSIITGYCKMELFDSALDWFRQDHVKKWSLNSGSCSDLIEGLCHMEKVQEATEIFTCINSKGCAANTNSVNILIQCLCLKGKVDEAIKLRFLALANGIASTPFMFESIARGLLEQTKVNDFLPLLAQMLIEGCTLNSTTYSILIGGLCCKSSGREAAFLFNQMVQADSIPDSETLETLICSVAKHSQLCLLVHSMDKIIEQGRLRNPTICNTIIYGLLKGGLKHEASRLLDWMLEKGWVPDADTHGLLVGTPNLEERFGTDESYEEGDGVSKILAEGLENPG